MSEAPLSRPIGKGNAAKFVIPAALGAMVFLGPVITEERQTVVFGLVTDALKGLLGAGIDEALLLVVGVSAIGALCSRAGGWSKPPERLAHQIFQTSWPWIVLRLLGFAIVAIVFFEIGPELLRLPDTGITVVKDIGQNVLVIYFGGLLLMPLLTEYGLMEFAGTLCRKPFQRLFRLPGRTAVDALTSITAASAIGLLVTISQYQKGYYNARQACTIACSFSLVSIPFCLLIAEIAQIEHLFFSWYLSVLTACILCAMVLCRIPPITRIPETQMNSSPVSEQPEEAGVRAAWQAALRRAAVAPGPRQYLGSALRAFAVNASGVIGPSIAIATLASLVLFHTPIATALSWPLAALLQLANIEQAGIIASGVLIGFADQFLPTLIAAQVNSELWRFVLAGLSVTQIVFMSEFGLLVLRSPLPLRLRDLAWVFLLRTLLTLPILIGMAVLIT